jgi:hypothetical protein
VAAVEGGTMTERKSYREHLKDTEKEPIPEEFKRLLEKLK